VIDPAEKTVLVLQGGVALGAYQAGAYEALAIAGHRPSWVAGISIGAVNSAIIAGNPPEKRVERLREFWERVSSRLLAWPLANDDNSRRIFNETSATFSAVGGVPGFFEPHVPPAVFQPQGTPEAISVYDTSPLKETLLELVDFDLLNSGAVRLSVGAVQVLSGNMKYFDTAKRIIGPEHIMASGALPPGFPPIEIDGSRTGTAGLCPIRRSNMCLSEAARARTWSSSRSTCSAPEAACRKRCSISPSGKRRSAIRAAPGSTPIFSARCRRSAGPSVICGRWCRMS
jgi:NTE family protein